MTDEISFPPLLDLRVPELQALKRHLLAEITHELEPRHSTFGLVPPRLAIAGATLALATAIAIVVFVAAPTGETSPTHGPNRGGLNGPVVFPPTSIALSDASTALGAPLVLPDPSLASPSDATATVSCYHNSGNTNSDCNDRCAQSGPNDAVSCEIWVSFPSQALRISYTRATSSNPLADYQSVVATNTDARVVYISGVPALAIRQPPDDRSTTTNYVRFVVGGTTITILDSSDLATAESMAKSIIDQANASDP